LSDLKIIFSPLLCALILLGFFLPFFNLTCQNQKIESVTGYEMMSGRTFSPPQLYKTGTSHPEELSPEPLAVISFGIASLALVLSFFRKATLFVGGLCAVGAITLLLLSSKMNNDITGRVEFPGLSVEWAIGMYICFSVFILIALLNAYFFYDSRYKPVDLEEVGQRMKICFNCGASNDRSNIYCNKCGSALA
jgi:hypothetical protein